ncbi:hypothetical protein DERP_008887 [Dermatophagoides pteronyssinus]|uniref:Uncharacterized protein n=1 Tax=Dermatophagoides pteronyssinus TaxID=6956 RepID=A0ABQ8JN46_DERPT|nr:hypothetical protein DERP_008887 [Dermatophagoides pteronyssinus]
MNNIRKLHPKKNDDDDDDDDRMKILIQLNWILRKKSFSMQLNSHLILFSIHRTDDIARAKFYFTFGCHHLIVLRGYI